MADAEVRAVAAAEHLWQRLSDVSVVVSRDRLPVADYHGRSHRRDGGASQWADLVVDDGRLEPMGPHQVAWLADSRAEREIAEWIRRWMAALRRRVEVDAVAAKACQIFCVRSSRGNQRHLNADGLTEDFCDPRAIKWCRLSGRTISPR